MYINDPKWKRIRYVIGLIYILIIIGLLIGSILLIIYSSRCPPKPKLVWYQKEIIYEIDVPNFYDSNQDAIGDIQGFNSFSFSLIKFFFFRLGIQDKLDYFEKNSIKSILLRSSIFNRTIGTSIQSNNQYIKTDLLNIDPQIGNETQLDNLIKNFNRKGFFLIIFVNIICIFRYAYYY